MPLYLADVHLHRAAPLPRRRRTRQGPRPHRSPRLRPPPRRTRRRRGRRPALGLNRLFRKPRHGCDARGSRQGFRLYRKARASCAGLLRNPKDFKPIAGGRASNPEGSKPSSRGVMSEAGYPPVAAEAGWSATQEGSEGRAGIGVGAARGWRGVSREEAIPGSLRRQTAFGHRRQPATSRPSAGRDGPALTPSTLWPGGKAAAA